MKHSHRFFVNETLSPGQTTYLDADDSFHASRVLRLGPGEQLELAGRDGRVFSAVVTRVDGFVEARAGEELGGRRLAGVELSVVQALPRGKKMDLVVEKLSEVGVTRLVPVYTEKSVARPRSGTDGKLERWRRVARSAAGQARRDRLMVVDEPCSLAAGLESVRGTLLALVTEADGRPLGEAVQAVGAAGLPLSLLVGPEAGFSEYELERMQPRGAVFVSLGPLVLRTETAALVASTIIMHRLGAIG